MLGLIMPLISTSKKNNAIFLTALLHVGTYPILFKLKLNWYHLHFYIHRDSERAS